MLNSIEEFKVFVKKHPKLRNEVRDKKRTWQNIYEEWVLLGDDGSWDEYGEEEKKETLATSAEGQEFLKKALQYVKKLNVDDITKSLGTVQKVVGIVQAFNGGSKKEQQNLNYTPRRRVDPLFRRFDDYDE